LSNPVHIYTDGACSGNPGKGGYGVVMIYGAHRKEMFEGFRLTTNNRMELLSVIVALESLKKEGLDVIVFSDSKYVVNAFEENWIYGWQKRGWAKVKNVDLWKRLIIAMKKHRVKFTWVKGHADNVENNRCDELAVAAYKMPNLHIDYAFEESSKQV
jgi:ribonuclease HI